MEETIATVDTPSMAYEEMAGYWQKVQTVLAGTEAMRAAGESMAPKHQNESETNYADRIQSNVLFNITDLTLRTWVGKSFASEIQYDEGFPDYMKEWLKDVNLEGDKLDVFARRWFGLGVAQAFCHVMVDFPRLDMEGRTALDDMNENVRPYAVIVEPERLIFATKMRIDGEEVLTHVRIKESVVSVDGWAEVVTEQVRVLTLEMVNMGTDDEPDFQQKVKVEIWQEIEEESAKDEDQWVKVDEWYMDIPFIPIVTFYSNRTAFMMGKSPLADLVDLNIRHWQSMSDQINILTVARFPMLAQSGGSADGDIVIGPKEYLFLDDPQGKFYYVEHRGTAIKAGREELKDLEEMMKAYGAEFMKDRPDRETASARNLDTAEATSPLQDVVFRFNDALNYVLWMMAQWAGQEYDSRAYVPTDFTTPDQAVLKVLFDSWSSGVLTDKEYLQELHRRGVLEDTFDFTNRSSNGKDQE